LIAYLTDPSPQNIVIEGTFDFVGSEGTKTYSACKAYACSPSEGGQALLNTLGGCGSLATYEVTLDAAGVEGINVASDKTLLGLDVNTVLNGKGLRFVGVSNIIIQNIEITNLNPQYVWGGDAFVFSDTDLI
jgi:pectin lyase